MNAKKHRSGLASARPKLKRFKLWTVPDVLAWPQPKWLVEQIVPAACVAQLYGPSGSGKSFIALDLALTIADGRPWLGQHQVAQGPVVYVAAEGHWGMKARIAAWLQHHRLDEEGLPGFRLLGETVQLGTHTDVKALIHAIGDEFPDQDLGLIVLDTQARCTEGLDENSSKDMGTAIASADEIRRATGATVLFVHHTGYDGSHARGSTAVKAALDVVIKLEGAKSALRLKCEKPRDAEEFDDIHVRLLKVGESLVVVRDSPDSPERLSLARDSLAGNQRTVLEALEAHPAGLKAKDWHEASGLARSSFYKARGSLMKKGLVEHEGDVYNFSARRSNESNPVQSKSNDVGQVEVQESNPPLGGGPLDQEAEEEDGGTGESDDEDDDLPPDTSTP